MTEQVVFLGAVRTKDQYLFFVSSSLPLEQVTASARPERAEADLTLVQCHLRESGFPAPYLEVPAGDNPNRHLMVSGNLAIIVRATMILTQHKDGPRAYLWMQHMSLPHRGVANGRIGFEASACDLSSLIRQALPHEALQPA